MRDNQTMQSGKLFSALILSLAALLCQPVPVYSGTVVVSGPIYNLVWSGPDSRSWVTAKKQGVEYWCLIPGSAEEASKKADGMSIDVPISFEGAIVEGPSQKASLLGALPKTPGVETHWKWEVLNPCRILRYGHLTSPKAAGVISTSRSQPKGFGTTSQPVLSNGAGEILLSPSIECAIDAKRAFQKGNGVEGREMMGRVLETGCGVMVPSGTPVVILKTELLYRFVKITAGKRAGQTGWVFAFWVR